MIVLDIETSGLDQTMCGIWQIAAMELESGEIFFDEGRIDDDDIVEQGALEATGKTTSELRSSLKKSQKELLLYFLRWIESVGVTNFICQNPQFDVSFIVIKLRKYGLYDRLRIPHRSFDLHSIASLKYYLVYHTFLLQDKKSKMDLSSVLLFCGMRDVRNKHNALEDVRLTAECFSRIVFGKKLLPEFKVFDMPLYLEVKE